MVSTSKLTIRSAADLVTVAPYLIGFHPDDGSLVAVVYSDGRVVFAARVDLPTPDAPEHTVRDLADCLIPVMQRQQPISTVVLIGYGDAGHLGPSLRATAEALTDGGLPVREPLHVADGRFFSLTCTDPACCPPQGTAYDPTVSLVAVQATVAGLVALPDRAAVAARFAPLDDTARDSMCRATLTALDRIEPLIDAASHDALDEAGATAVRDALRTHDNGGCLSDDETAWLTLLLTHTSVRDLAVELTEPHDRHVTFWAEVTRRAHEPLVPAPAMLLALTAWRCGDGALATMATERALQVDPDDQLAGLLLHATQAGLAPSVIEQALRGNEQRTGASPTAPRPQPISTDPASADDGRHDTARRIPHPPETSTAPGKPADKE